MRYFRYMALLLAAACFAASCVEENFEPVVPAGGEGLVYVDFTSPEFDVVATKSTLGYASESNVFNIMVFIFNSDGNKVFGKWFDAASKVEGKDDLTQDTWYVENTTTVGTNSHGGMMLRAPSGSGYKVYLLANLDADMVKASSDYLQYKINSEADLLDFQVEMNQRTVYRNGYFPMTGRISGVTISEGGDLNRDNAYNSSSDPLTVRIPLKRLDAKIKFIFKVGTRYDENSENPQVINAFTAEKWKVVNVPMTGYAMDYASRGYEDTPASCGHDSWNVPPDTPVGLYANYAPYFFDTEWINFEDFPNNGESGFSFYMLENRMQPKNGDFAKASDYNAFEGRSRQMKTGGMNESVQVSYVNNEGNDVTKRFLTFENANDFSTYVLVKGKVDMTLEDDIAGQVLGAEVQYMIHLGDWNVTAGATAGKDSYSGVANYNTLRNTDYTYTVTINSVNNIRVEVETSADPEPAENQPGAIGDVTIAKEEIALCDAHYTSKTLSFHAYNLIQVTDLGGGNYNFHDASKTLTWKVSTPFSTGQPNIVNGVDVPTGLDYKWVKFRLNKKDAGGSYFESERRNYCGESREYEETAEYRDAAANADMDGTPGLPGYHNDGLMDIIMLVKNIKKYVAEYCQYLNMGGDAGYIMFDNADKMLLSDGSINRGPDAPKVSITVFVDEFYYDKDPIFGTETPTLWKKFVNVEDRTVHILSNSSQSADGESTATGSVVTIKQRSIQSIYNTNENVDALLTAWGCEHVDEYEKDVEIAKRYETSVSQSENANRGNTDLYNGRLNTAREWLLCSSSETSFTASQSWDKYINAEVDNDTPMLKTEYKDMRHACMTRNRDNNGNGLIDQDEVRWYLASDKQLTGLFLGDFVLTKEARLYNRTAEDKADAEDTKMWRQHVVSSTRNGANSHYPTVFWAEEGISNSYWGQDTSWGDPPSYWSIRCVRNLGIPNSADLSEVPQDCIQVEGNVISAEFLNDASLRYYTSRELDFHSEISTENRIYKKFEVNPEYTSFGTALRFNGTMVDPGNGDFAIRDAYKCPEGWRYPNQRELYLFTAYLGYDGQNSVCRTAWSLGNYASEFGQVSKQDKDGFLFYNGDISLGTSYTSSGVRCVRDIR